jgi:hypothetical protein
MKRYVSFGLFVLFSLTSLYSNAQNKKKVFIEASINMDLDEEAKGDLQWRVETMYKKKLLEAFSCLEVLTNDAVRREIDALRMDALAGGSDGLSAMSNKLCGYNYFLKGNITRTSSGLTACTAYLNRLAPVRNYGSKSSRGQNADPYALAAGIATQLMDELGENELCPYIGTMTIHHKNTVDSKSKKTIPVDFTYPPCSGTQTIIHNISSDYNAHWQINRVEKGAALGSVQCDFSEMIEESDENSCHICSPLLLGPRSWEKTTFSSIKATKVSSESVSPLGDSNDTRVTIKFNPDDTYYVFVKATTTFESNSTMSVTEFAEGICDSKNEKKSQQTSKSVFIEGIFGPFNGSSIDKTLSQKGSIQPTSTIQGESGTIDYDFSFSR